MLPTLSCLRPYRFTLLLFALLFVLEAGTAAPENDSLEQGLRQLADRIMTIPNFHGPVRLEIRAEPALGEGPGTGWKDSVRQELEKRRIAVTEEPSAPLLVIAAAETPAQVVLSASIGGGERSEVRIVSFPRALLPAVALPVAPVRLERQLVYATAERILDASSLGDGTEGGLAVLLYRDPDWLIVRLDANGSLQQSVSLAAAGTRPSRDPHGELNFRGSEAEVTLPGKSCQLSWTGAGEAKCYAIKATEKESRGATVLSSPCDGSGWKLLANGSDWTSQDLLQVVPEATSRKESAAVLSQFPGPIVSINGEQNPNSALVVTRNLRTGNDEVYKITLACGN